MSVFRMSEEQYAARLKNAAEARKRIETRLSPRIVGEANVGAVGKYGNKPTNGYDSKKEAKRAEELKLLQAGGAIRNLRQQVQYILIPKQLDPATGKCLFRAVTWTADFVYDELQDGLWIPIVEDVKGYPNDRWAMKKALMYFVHRTLIRQT